MKRQRKLYIRPKRPYDSQRIKYEKELLKKYGLRRKREIWRSEYILKEFRRVAMEIVANYDKKKEDMLLGKLKSLGVLSADATVDDVLALDIEDILNRRLQTIVFKKGLANTIKQARQFVVHGHIAIEGRRIKWPSALVGIEEENKIGFYSKSKLNQNFAKKEVKKGKEEGEKVGKE